MKYVLNPLAIYELGQRSNQEDSIFPVSGEVTAEDRLFIVCDGMGGHESGEVASQTVCQTMSEYILSQTSPEGAFTDEQFNEALNAAYDSLDQKDNGAAKKMGTTMTLLKFHSGGCLLAHIGDSRIDHIRPSERYIFHTRDHSLINDLYDIGEITLEEMKTSKQKNVITRAMQPNLERRPKADIKHITDIRPGDYFFMCSDGMLEETDDSDLLNILSDPDTTDDEKIQILTKVSENNRDNHSAFLIHILDLIPDNYTKEAKGKEESPIESVPDNRVMTAGTRTIEREGKKSAETKEDKRQKRRLPIVKILAFAILLFIVIYAASFVLLKAIKGEKEHSKTNHQIENTILQE